MNVLRRGLSALFCCFLLIAAFTAESDGQAVTLVQTNTRYAGTGFGGFSGDFGPATSVALNQPSFMVFDSLGNQFLSDTLNNCVRRVDASGNTTTVAGLRVTGQGDTCNTATNATPTPAQGLLKPTGLAVDSANNLYIADAGHNCIRMLPANSVGAGLLTTIAGTCGSAASTSATPAPSGIAIDAASNLYISIQDTEVLPVVSNYQVLKHTSGAAATSLCVVAGSASVLVPTTCTGAFNNVTLSAPSGLALDFGANLYVADTGNNCVRQVVGNAAVATIAGRCTNDSTGNSTSTLNSPFGLVFSLVQSLFISESNPNIIVRYVPSTGVLTQVAGLPSGAAGSYSSVQDGTSALNIPLNSPRGMVVDANANFYVADSASNIVRQLSYNIIFPTTPVNSPSAAQPVTFVVNQTIQPTVTLGPDYTLTSTTCSGTLSPAAAGNPPTTCQAFVRFTPTRPDLRYSPLHITDAISNKVVSQGLQGTGTGALGVFAPGVVNTIAKSLSNPVAVSTDSAGNAYVLERGTTAGTADLLVLPAGGGASTVAIAQGTGLVTPVAIATDAGGNWYVADSTQGTVARFGADGSINPTYLSGLTSPSAVYVDGFGNLYIAQQGTAHNVIEAYASGPIRVVAGSGTVLNANGVAATTAQFVSPGGLTLDLDGVLYIADTGGHRVYAVDRTGLIHFVAGNGTTTTSSAGTALGTALLAPTSLATDAAADIYIADSAANRVYTVYAASASGTNIASILGNGTPGNSGDGGSSILAQVNGPLSVALDSSSNAFVVDGGNNSVREITYPNPTLAFGTVSVGQTSAAKLQFFGDVGTDSLNLTEPFSTTDSHFNVYASSTTCGTAILPGAVCDVAFTFTPTAPVAYSATSILTSNSYNSPEPILLTGTGQVQLPLPATFTPPSEVYGQSFPIAVSAPNGSNPAATGTLTYSVNGVTICSFTGTISPSSVCNAPNSGLSVGTYPVVITYSGDVNYVPSTGSTTLTVTPEPLSITGATLTRAYGQPNPTLTGTVTGAANGDTFLASYTTTATITSPVGSYPITATLTPVGSASLSNYTVTNTPGTLIVTQAALSVTVLNATRQYGQPNPAFLNTVSGSVNGDTFTFSYSTSATITSPVGTYPITVTVGGSAAANYTVTVIPGTLTVTPAPLTLTVNNATRPYATPNPTFTGTITGALNGDTFTSTFSTTATISSPVGTYPITGTLSGSAASNYTITSVPGTLTITKATANLNVAANNASRAYGAANPTFTSTVTGALNGDTFTITYTTTATATSPVGTYTITPTVSGAAAANYNVTTSNGTLTVTPATLTVTANNATRPYGAANPTFTGTTVGLVNGDTVTTTYATSATIASPVGTYPIVPTVTGAGLSNYTLTTANGTLTITPATAAVTITVASASRTYGAANPTFTGTITGALNGDVLTASYTTTATVTSPVGTYPITATLTGPAAANYTPIIIPGTLTVTPAALNVAANNATRSYGTPNPVFTGTTTGLLNGDTITTSFTTTATIASPVGTYPITASATGAALSNYTLTTTPGTLTITQATGVVTVTVAGASRTYGAPNPTFTSTVVGALNGDILTVSYSTTATVTSPVGTYPITATLTGPGAGNYVATIVPGTLTVTPAALNVTANNATRAYGTANPVFTGTTTGLVNGDTITTSFATTATITSHVGTYPITVTATGAALSNYTLTTTPGTLTITQATAVVTVTVANASRAYGAANPTFSSTIVGALNGDVLTATYSTTATVTSPVGTYPITATLTGPAAANYTPIIVPGTLTVTPAALNVTANNATRAYGTANPVFTGTTTGLVNGDTITTSFATTATITSPVGTYPITVTATGAALSNYTLTTTPGTLTITQATAVVTVTVANASRVYGAANPTFSSTIVGALNGDVLTASYSTTATVTSPVGTYPITATLTGSAAANYTPVIVPGTLTVTPAALNVTANNATRPYGTANPVFTGTTTGLVNGDTITTSFATTATITSPVGTYPITVTATGAALSNYTLTTTPGTLTITQGSLAATITVNSVSRVFGSANPTFTGTVTGAVNGDVLGATFSTTATAASPVGTYPITAVLTGANAANYTATVVPGTLTITPAPTTTVVTTSGSPSAFGAAVTFTATVSSTAGTPGGSVTFTSGGTTLGTGTLNAAGVTTVTTSALPSGSDVVTATYGATTNFSTSSGTVTQVVGLVQGAFTLSANPPTQLIRGAGTTVYNVIVTSVGSFTGPVALTCAGLPADATCVFSSPTVTLTAGAPTPLTMTVTTTNADAKVIAPANPFHPSDFAPITAAVTLPFELSGFGLLFAGIRRRKPVRSARTRMLLMLVVSAGMVALAGCNCITSVFQTYTITITGTAVNGNAPTQSTSVLLSVGQQ